MPMQFDHEKLHAYGTSIKFTERGPFVWMQKIQEQATASSQLEYGLQE